MDSIYKELFTPYGIMLNGPAYRTPDDDIGFVTRVYPGLKENASIFSHPNPWAWAAECVLGRGDRQWSFTMLSVLIIRMTKLKYGNQNLIPIVSL